MQKLLGANCNAHIDATDNYEATPLHVACNTRHTEIVKILLVRGCDFCKKIGKKCALHIAANDDQMDIVEMLLQHDSDLRSLNSDANVGMVRYAHSLLHMTDASVKKARSKISRTTTEKKK